MTGLDAALAAAAAGVLPGEAAVSLLAGAGCFTCRPDFTGRSTESGHGNGIVPARTGWEAASLRDSVTSLDDRNLALVIKAIRHAGGQR